MNLSAVSTGADGASIADAGSAPDAISTVNALHVEEVMHLKFIPNLGRICFAALLFSTIATAARPHELSMSPAPQESHADALAKEAPFLTENAAAMEKMMADMNVRPTGDVDADFVAMMIPHHQGAIDMALAVLRHGKNQQIRRIAQEIIVEQQQEIAAMRLALGQPLPPSAPAPTQSKRPVTGVQAPTVVPTHDHSITSHGTMSAPSATQMKREPRQ